tara:strand:+ start:7943 stop:8299 length:357 start_codon:yes stop_codon:yes gene_type:complete
MIEHFKPSEFNCCCGSCYDMVNQDSLHRLDLAREMADVPFKINSSWRCENNNTKVGGKSTSAHLRGTAFDIACEHSTQRFGIVHALLDAGFTRVGIGSNFIHADDDSELPNEVMWLYK